MQKQFLVKLKQEEQTLLGLKQMCGNMGSAGRQDFYASYFRLDPTTQFESLWNVLGYYVYGLKFVFEYYFKNLSSWSWYYPYYFAPLLTDLQLYLQALVLNEQAL
jgi:5'-3' exoribonuclease 2